MTKQKNCSSESVSSFERHWEDGAHFHLSRHRFCWIPEMVSKFFSHFEGVICKAKDKGSQYRLPFMNPALYP